MPRAVSMASIDSRTTASYREACSRVRGTGWSVSVLGGSSGTMPGSDFLRRSRKGRTRRASRWAASSRSEEHTSELQSRENLVCRLLLEKKNNTHKINHVEH